MNKDDQKRKEALARLQAAREKKQASLVQLEKYMRKIYKERTGKDAGEFLHYEGLAIRANNASAPYKVEATEQS